MCAVPGSCPGRDWPENARTAFIKLAEDRDRLHRLVAKRAVLCSECEKKKHEEKE
jgi:hypothetical protein